MKRGRHDDRTSGPFTQPDPIGLAGGLNLYGYAGGDPVNGSDPFGLTVVFANDEARYQYDRLKAIAGGMARSKDGSTRAEGEALLGMLSELEKSDTEVTVSVDRKQLWVFDVGTRTGEFSKWRTGLEGPGVNISTREFPGQPAPALLAHELAHAHHRWVQDGGPPSNSDRRDMSSPTNVFAIRVENAVRAAVGCRFLRPLTGHGVVTPCR